MYSFRSIYFIMYVRVKHVFTRFLFELYGYTMNNRDNNTRSLLKMYSKADLLIDRLLFVQKQY